LLAALKVRVKRHGPLANVAYVAGSCDSHIEQICNEIPKGSPTNKVLSFCLVDPFDFGIKFDTLRRLSSVYIDFVVLLAIGMDANRNYDHYVDGESTKLDEALGNTEWRQRWKTAAGVRKRDFRQFLAAEFLTSMKSLNYLEQPCSKTRCRYFRKSSGLMQPGTRSAGAQRLVQAASTVMRNVSRSAFEACRGTLLNKASI